MQRTCETRHRMQTLIINHARIRRVFRSTPLVDLLSFILLLSTVEQELHLLGAGVT